MSIAVQKRVWSLQIAAPEKLVLLCLANYARNEDQRAFPSVATIAADTCLSERQVQRHLASLVEAGFITIDDNPYGGRGKSRIYRFKLGKGDADDTVSENKRVTSMTQKDDADDTLLPQERVTSRTERVTSTAEKGDIHDATYIRSEPRENHQEPSMGEIRHFPASATTKPAVRGDNPEHLFVNEYYRLVGGAPTNHGKDIGHAKKLLNAGVYATDIPSLIEWARTSYYGREGFDLGTFVVHLNKWRTWSSSRPAKANAKGGLVYG